MTEHVITSKCDSPLLQAFVDNYLLLVKIAARIVGCRSRAEDVVQDAFFRLRSAPQATLTFKAQLSYLFQIVRNLAIDHYRKQALEQKYTGPEAEGLNVVIQGASPEISHINFSSLEKIADALTELPPRTRYAFEMYRLHGVPQKDIAKELRVADTGQLHDPRCADSLPQGQWRPGRSLIVRGSDRQKNPEHWLRIFVFSLADDRSAADLILGLHFRHRRGVVVENLPLVADAVVEKRITCLHLGLCRPAPSG